MHTGNAVVPPVPPGATAQQLRALRSGLPWTADDDADARRRADGRAAAAAAAVATAALAD
eukprot:COSAG02_NODE_2137_length_9694_cov_51.871287_1_plen_59_part_10